MPASPTKNTGSSPFLRLRLSSLLALAFLGVAAIALAYVGGVMTGRASASAERRLAAVETGRVAPQAPAEAGGEAPTQAPQETPPILSPEELRFARALRNEDGAPEPAPVQPRNSAVAVVPAPRTPPVAPPASPDLPPAAVPQGVPPLPVGEAAPAQTAAAQPLMQDYVFQVGAFRDEDSVDSLRQRLEGRGLRTRMQKEGKLYVVLVLLRGDESRAGEVMRIAEELRLGKPMIRSRKAVRQ